MRIVAVVALVRGVRVMPRRGCRRIPIGKGEQRTERDWIGSSGYGCLCLADPEAGLSGLGRCSVGEHGRQRNTEWDEKRLLLHGLGNICVPVSDCQASGSL
jgi:hypothetical protein